MSREIAAIAAALLTLALLATAVGCGGDSGGRSTGAAVPNTTAVTAEKPLGVGRQRLDRAA